MRSNPVGSLEKLLTRRIREVCAERHVTLSHLPDLAGVARSAFWEVLGGRVSPTLDWVQRIATALGVDPIVLLTPGPTG